MTLLVPLDGVGVAQSQGTSSYSWTSSSTLPAGSASSSASPPTTSSCPAFVSPASDPAASTARVVQAILGARRIAIVCGAGISVQAGIPDFRSADGLFQSIKRENPKESLSSGKDLFDASVFNSEQTTALFCQMMGRLARLSADARPTPFHDLLRELDARGKLMRVYTQNIDALEERTGLSFGLPEQRSRRSKGKESALGDLVASSRASSPSPAPSSNGHHDVPRCIPLHGTLQTMHCVVCTHVSPLAAHLSSLLASALPDCPACTTLASERANEGKRARSVGKLRPSVVLYNEAHPDGERVGAVVRRDLAGLSGSGRSAPAPDLLLVVGTALRVPGTKRIVREFARGVRERAKAKAERASEAARARRSTSSSTLLPTPAPTPLTSPAPSPAPQRGDDSDGSGSTSGAGPSSAGGDRSAITTVYLNLDFPMPTREWEGVFDVWVRGDAQAFAGVLRAALERADRERVEKAAEEERAREERREREERRRMAREAREREREEKERKRRRKHEVEAKVKGKKRSTGSTSTVGTPPAKRRRLSVSVKQLATPPKSPKKLGKTTKDENCPSSEGKSSRKPHTPAPPKEHRAPLPLPRVSSGSSISSLSSLSSAEDYEQGEDVSATSTSDSSGGHRRAQDEQPYSYPTPLRNVYLKLKSCTARDPQPLPQQQQRTSSLDLLANAALSMERVHLSQGYVSHNSGTDPSTPPPPPSRKAKPKMRLEDLLPYGSLSTPPSAPRKVALNRAFVQSNPARRKTITSVETSPTLVPKGRFDPVRSSVAGPALEARKSFLTSGKSLELR